MRALIASLFIAVLGFSSLATAADPGDAIVGTWMTNDGSSKVQISNAQGVYNGQVVWLKEPVFPADDNQGMAGQPKVDRLNPEAALRTRLVMGLVDTHRLALCRQQQLGRWNDLLAGQWQVLSLQAHFGVRWLIERQRGRLRVRTHRYLDTQLTTRRRCRLFPGTCGRVIDE